MVTWLSRLSYFAFVFSIAVLAATSFGSMGRFGHMSHYSLIVHMAFAGAFTFLLPIMAAVYFARDLSRKPGNRRRCWLESLSAWLLITTGLVTAGTMFLSMLPLLDTVGLLEVVSLHRYFGFATTLMAAIHLFSVIAGYSNRTQPTNQEPET